MLSEKDYALLKKIHNGGVTLQSLTAEELRTAKRLKKMGLIEIQGLDEVPDSSEIVEELTDDNTKKRCRNRYPYGYTFLLSLTTFLLVRVLLSLFEVSDFRGLFLALLLVGLCFSLVFLFKRSISGDSEDN